jgi:two-component system, NarL family, response regulator DesR
VTELIDDTPRDLSETDGTGQGTPVPVTSTVLLAEDLDLLRDAVVCLLGRQPDLAVVAALKCRTDTVLPVALRCRPDVAVVDVGTSRTQGMDAIWQLRKHLPECQVVALVPRQHPGLVRQSLDAGVRAVIDADAPAARLLHAIRAAARAEAVIDLPLAIAAQRLRPNPLTTRERGVLRLAAIGESSP